ncbi:MAG TPA: hypothetical protein VM032_19055 [Vicinamibacterales bacterium]|nr:hypothetical protein [Vicinamibacterales bacterium]
MLKGVHLTLLMGPAVPVPAPRLVLDALQSVEVTVNDTGPSVFQLQFSIGKRSPLETIFLLTAGAAPINLLRVVVMVTVAGAPTVLIDGIVTQQQLLPGSDADHSTLSITGEDLSVVMRQIDFSGFPFPATPAEGRVGLLLLKYAWLGILPMVIPSVMIDVPIPTSQIPSQQGTDYDYINALADKVGYVFYLEPQATPGTSVAYWGPQIKVGVPQPALTVNSDGLTNCEALSFVFDNQAREMPAVVVYNELTKVPIPIPIPNITPLSPPLGAVEPLALKLRPIEDVSKYSIPKALMIGMAKAARTADAVKGDGSLDVLRYGRVLQPRRLVGVRGAGLAFDGLHYVKSVTHQIKRGEYKQRFKLVRNGLLSTVPAVPA